MNLAAIAPPVEEVVAALAVDGGVPEAAEEAGLVAEPEPADDIAVEVGALLAEAL